MKKERGKGGGTRGRGGKTIKIPPNRSTTEMTVAKSEGITAAAARKTQYPQQHRQQKAAQTTTSLSLSFPHHKFIRNLVTSLVSSFVTRQLAFLVFLSVVVVVHVFDELLWLPAHHLVEFEDDTRLVVQESPTILGLTQTRRLTNAESVHVKGTRLIFWRTRLVAKKKRGMRGGG